MSGAALSIRVALLLDEMHAPVVASTLRTRGHDVVAVADDLALRALPDEEIFAYAGEHGRRVVTETVKDFRRLLLRAEEAGQVTAGVLFTSSRTFPRSRRTPGPINRCARHVAARPWRRPTTSEDWLAVRR